MFQTVNFPPKFQCIYKKNLPVSGPMQLKPVIRGLTVY